MQSTLSTTCSFALVVAFAGLLAGPTVDARVKPLDLRTEQILLRGRTSQHRSFESTLDLSQDGEEVFLHQQLTFADGSRAELFGSGRWTHGQLVATLRADRSSPQTRLVLTLDGESGFCVVRSTSGAVTRHAVGRRAGAPAVVAPEPPPNTDLAGWTLEVPGTVHHAVRVGDMIYVAAGEAGVQIVDLDSEAVVGSIETFADAMRLTVVGSELHVMCADDQVRVLDVADGAPTGAVRSPTTAQLDAWRIGERRYALTRTHVLELSAAGEVLTETPLGVTLADNGEQWLVDVEDDQAILALHGVGLVFLDL